MGLFDFLRRQNPPGEQATSEAVRDNADSPFAFSLLKDEASGTITWTLKSDISGRFKISVHARRHYVDLQYANDVEDDEKNEWPTYWLFGKEVDLSLANENSFSAVIDMHAADQEGLDDYKDSFALPLSEPLGEEIVIGCTIQAFTHEQKNYDAIKITETIDFPIAKSIHLSMSDHIGYCHERQEADAKRRENCLIIHHKYGPCVYDIDRVELSIRDDYEGGKCLGLSIRTLDNKFCYLGMNSGPPNIHIEGAPVSISSIPEISDLTLKHRQGWKDDGGPVYRIYQGIHAGLNKNLVSFVREGNVIHIHWTADCDGDYRFFLRDRKTTLEVFATYLVE